MFEGESIVVHAAGLLDDPANWHTSTRVINERYRKAFNSDLVEGATFSRPNEMPEIQAMPGAVPLPPGLIACTDIRENSNKSCWIHHYKHDICFQDLLDNVRKHQDVYAKFAGVIGPDCSLDLSMPLPVQIAETYMDRAVSFYLQRAGLLVCPNVRWSDQRSFLFCFEGLPVNATVAIGTVGCLASRKTRYYFSLGLAKMLEVLTPTRILVLWGYARRHLWTLFCLHAIHPLS